MKNRNGLIVVVHVLALGVLCSDALARKTIFAGDDDIPTIYGEENGERFGTDLETCDVNGDGVADIVASAPLYEDLVTGRFERGAIYLFYGRSDHQWPIDLRTYPGDLVIHGADDEDRAGFSMGCGDLDGDGYDDLAIGAPRADGPGNTRSLSGELYVFYGRPDLRGVIDLAVESPDALIYGADAEDSVGGIPGEEAADTVLFGDINLDGFDDLLIGCFGGDGPVNAGDRVGEVFVFWGGFRLPAVVDLAVDSPDMRIYGFGDLSYTGSCLATGDINADGKNDLIISSERWDGWSNEREDAGRVDVFFGRETWPGVIDLAHAPSDVSFWGDNDRRGFTLGSSLACGDVNDDGNPDLLTSARYAWGKTDPLLNRSYGRAYGVFGKSTYPPVTDLVTDSLDVTIYGRDKGDDIGSALQAADVNNDGIDDIVVASFHAEGPDDTGSDVGEAYVIYGGPGLQAEYELETFVPDVTVYGPLDSADFGYRVKVADFTGDGLNDLIMSSPDARGISVGSLMAGTIVIIPGTAPPGPFDLYRNGGDPSNLPLYASLVDSYFDEPPGLLSDGQLLFYEVESRAGDDVTIALWPEPHADTVRITWDDGGIGAYVTPDPSLTEVTVSPSCLSADGVTRSYVSVWPRDTYGVRLGPGYDVAIDPGVLFPGVPAEAQYTHLSGAYTLPVVSTQTGTATVSAYLEGVPLPSHPQIHYVDTVPIVDFAWSEPVTAGSPATFTSTTSGGAPPYTFAWYFGDKDHGTSSEENPTFVYTVPGTYGVAVSVTDSSACVDSGVHDVVVLP